MAEQALPLVTVTSTTKPVIDGTIRRGEWDGAAAVAVPRVLGTRALRERSAVAWITYDDTNLYLAVRCPLPKGVTPRANVKTHDGRVWEDDAVEVFVGPDASAESYYQFIGNCAGTTWESRGKDGAWNCPWTCRASVQDGHWDAEMAIPFSQLGAGSPADGTTWRFNLACDSQARTRQVSTWAPMENTLHDPRRFGRIVFRRDAPVFQFTTVRMDYANGALIVGGRAIRAGEKAKAAATLLNLGRNGATEIVTKQQTLEAQASRFEFNLPLPREDGVVVPAAYQVRWFAVTLDQRLLAEGMVELEVPAPLELVLRKYFLSGRVEAEAKVNRVPGTQWPTEIEVETQIRRAGAAGPALRRGTSAPTDGVARATFDVAGLDAGEYEVVARVLGADGKELAAVSEEFEKPERPAWLGSKEGITDEVLPPWTPLRMRGASVRPWGRRYDFDRLPFPSKVTTAGAQVLAGPIRLVALVDGKPQAWQGERARVKRRSDSVVELATSAESDRLRISGTVSIEYDGLIRSDFEIASRDTALLESLVMEIPLKEEHAKYLYHFPGRWGSAYNAGALPEEGWSGPFRPFIWLGDEERGLSWFCESERNWSPADANAVTEIVRDNGTVVLRLHIVDEPRELREPLADTFGFEATPVKPMEETVWDYRICHAGSYGIEDRPYREEARLTYPAEGNISLDEGTLEMWVRVEFDPNVEIDPDVSRGIYNRNLFLLSLPDGDAVGFYWNIDDRGMRFYVREAGKFPIVMGSRQDWRKGELHHLALTWGDKARIYVDGELQVERAYQGLIAGDVSRASLVFGGGACDFAVDEIRISDVARPPEEFFKPHEPDEETLLLDHLDEAFEPDGVRQTRAARGAFPGDETGGTVSRGARFAPVKFGNGLELYGTGEPKKTCLDRLAELGVRTMCFHEHWTDIQNYTSTTHGDALHRLVKACHERGIRLLLYFGYEMSNIAPEWPLYSDECLVFPRAGGYHRQPEQRAYIVCYNSPWQDFIADGIAKMIDEYDIDGVYLDGTANPWACRNVHHGCGYTKPDGSIGPTYGIFAAREMMRRIYTIVKTRKPNGLVNVHQSTCMTIPSVGWATSYWDGEQFGGIERGPFALEVLPLDAFRCEFMGHQWGVPAEFLCYGRPYTYNQAMSFTLLHDVLVRGSGLGPNLERESLLWHIMDDFGRKRARWLPYWANAEYVSASPDAIKVSLYSHGRRGVLAVVSNLSADEVRAQVRLSLGRLGLKANVTARDRITDEAVPTRNGAMHFPMKALTYRVIEVK
ncbi:MAG: glycoside hydrolase domain-containing protein [Armatimonadota bacterium]